MPHKHTRREKDPSTYDLPPNQIAKPLPVHSQPANKDRRKTGTHDGGKDLKRKRDAATKDDAPRAFKRLMAYAGGKRTRSGLDDGEMPRRKTKKNGSDAAQEPESQTDDAPELPKIRPGERMSEFAARVDASLPISGLVNKSERGGKDSLGLKVWRTNKEKKMHKLYDQWREEERKIQERRAEELELQAEKELEDEENGVSWKVNMESGTSSSKKKKKGKRAKMLGETAGREEDPWEELKRKRGEERAGLNDVAKAPPELHMKMSKKIMVRGATVAVDGVPKAAGSLRRREELQGAREDVISAYRKLMDGKRPSLRSG